jgi:hypothetical protein
MRSAESFGGLIRQAGHEHSFAPGKTCQISDSDKGQWVLQLAESLRSPAQRWLGFLLTIRTLIVGNLFLPELLDFLV